MNIVLIVNTNNRTTIVAMNNNKPTLGLFNNNKPLQDISCWGTWRTGAALCTSRIIYFRVACPAVKSTRGGAPVSPVSLPFYLLIDFLPFLFVELHVHVWLIVERKKLSFRFLFFSAFAVRSCLQTMLTTITTITMVLI